MAPAATAEQAVVVEPVVVEAAVVEAAVVEAAAVEPAGVEPAGVEAPLVEGRAVEAPAVVERAAAQLAATVGMVKVATATAAPLRAMGTAPAVPETAGATVLEMAAVRAEGTANSKELTEVGGCGH
jgi:hypothetical protein